MQNCKYNIAMFFALATTACENRQVVIVDVQNINKQVTTIGVYARVGSADQYKYQNTNSNLLRYGIEVPVEKTGTLSFHAFGYSSGSPCIKGYTPQTYELQGAGKQTVSQDLGKQVPPCGGSAEPIVYPLAKMVVWANASNDIWLAGEGGLILRWNGTSYSAISLPASLSATLPTWKAVIGRGPNDVWFSGTNNAIAQWNGVSLLDRTLPTSTTNVWNGIAFGHVGISDVWVIGNNGTYAIINEKPPIFSSCQHSQTKATQDLKAISCVSKQYSSSKFFDDCWMASDNTLYRYTLAFGCVNYSDPTMYKISGVTDIMVNAYDNGFELILTGRNRLLRRASAAFAFPGDPYSVGLLLLNDVKDNYSAILPTDFQGDLLSLHGVNGLKLWISGTNGALFRWESLLDGMPSQQATRVPTGLTDPLGSVAGLPSGAVVAPGN